MWRWRLAYRADHARYARPAAGGPPAAPGWREDTYAIKICFYETPFIATITNRFIEDRLQSEYEINVAFGPTKLPMIEGRLG